MPGPEPMQIVRVPGLVPGGNTCGNKDPGYILFFRQGPTDTDESVEEAIFRLVNKYQVQPFIEQNRRRVFGWDGNPATLTPEMLADASSDGALGQYKFLTSDAHIEQCANLLIIKTKGHASRTSVEQMSDIAQKYRILKQVMMKPAVISGTVKALRQVTLTLSPNTHHNPNTHPNPNVNPHPKSNPHATTRGYRKSNPAHWTHQADRQPQETRA